MNNWGIGRQVRVLLVDDHPHGREGMREIVEIEPLFHIVGEAASGEEALALAPDLKPDVVLMDINMPGIGGLEATYRLKRELPALKIVMVTVSDDIANLFEAVKRGAQGYLLKNLDPSSWLDYLRAVAVDEAPLSKELAYRLLLEFSAGGSAGEAGAANGGGFGSAGRGRFATGEPFQGASVPPAPASAAKQETGTERAGGSPERQGRRPDERHPSALTEREREVLERVATGASNREIAEALGISEHTVKNHLKNILQKLHLDNRVKLARYALEQGIVRRE